MASRRSREAMLEPLHLPHGAMLMPHHPFPISGRLMIHGHGRRPLPSAVLLDATTRAYDLPFVPLRMTASQQGIEVVAQQW